MIADIEVVRVTVASLAIRHHLHVDEWVLAVGGVGPAAAPAIIIATSVDDVELAEVAARYRATATLLNPDSNLLVEYVLAPAPRCGDFPAANDVLRETALLLLAERIEEHLSRRAAPGAIVRPHRREQTGPFAAAVIYTLLSILRSMRPRHEDSS